MLQTLLRTASGCGCIVLRHRSGTPLLARRGGSKLGGRRAKAWDPDRERGGFRGPGRCNALSCG